MDKAGLEAPRRQQQQQQKSCMDCCPALTMFKPSSRLGSAGPSSTSQVWEPAAAAAASRSTPAARPSRQRSTSTQPYMSPASPALWNTELTVTCWKPGCPRFASSVIASCGQRSMLKSAEMQHLHANNVLANKCSWCPGAQPVASARSHTGRYAPQLCFSRLQQACTQDQLHQHSRITKMQAAPLCTWQSAMTMDLPQPGGPSTATPMHTCSACQICMTMLAKAVSLDRPLRSMHISTVSLTSRSGPDQSSCTGVLLGTQQPACQCSWHENWHLQTCQLSTPILAHGWKGMHAPTFC